MFAAGPAPVFNPSVLLKLLRQSRPLVKDNSFSCKLELHSNQNQLVNRDFVDPRVQDSVPLFIYALNVPEHPGQLNCTLLPSLNASSTPVC